MPYTPKITDKVLISYGKDGSIASASVFFGRALPVLPAVVSARLAVVPRPLDAGKPVADAAIVAGFKVVGGKLAKK